MFTDTLKKIFISSSIILGVMSCSDSTKTTALTSLNPTPSDPATLEAQLKRFEGQTEFLNPQPWSSGLHLERSLAGPGGKAVSKRAIQESDVFKIGNEDSKLLFLLNNLRGLQVVSYEDGVESPKIIGRVNATGNWPSDMYYDNANDRLLVLENNWFDRDLYSWGHSENSRVVVYDVSDPNAPKITDTLILTGELADSRMVGEVLYVATSAWPNYLDTQSNPQSKGKGIVAAVSLNEDKLKVVGQHKLSLPISRRENMNIVESSTGTDAKGIEQFEYYLVAVLSEGRWGWWDTTSVVEVVNITDPKGAIKSVMIARPKGVVRERSQTLVKDHTLIVTSNYSPDFIAEPKDRVAVETFNFPGEKPTILETDEAKFRHMYIERARKNGKLTLDSKEYLKLIKDPKLGLSGRYVNSESGTVEALYPDSLNTIGDTNGLHASLRDVRYSDDGSMLYAFWVPRERSQLKGDPLEVFDISNPAEGVKHLDHLEFPGYIERAFPVSYNKKNYIVALGYIEPSLNNESRKRFGQALLVEIIKRGKRVTAVDVEQFQLGSEKLNPRLQGADKLTSFKVGTDGKGYVLFEATDRANNWWRSGGKLLGFNLNEVEAGGKIFKEGGFIPASSGWLKRVFANPEIDSLNTFTDKALAAFKVASSIDDIGAADKVFEAVSILELARNIRGYAVIKESDTSKGVQIISEYSWSRTETDSAKTQLRLVDPKKADSEKQTASQNLEIEGTYQNHYATEDGRSLLVVTSIQKKTLDPKYHVYRTEVAKQILSFVTLNPKQQLQVTSTEDLSRDHWSTSFIKVGVNLLLSSGQKLYTVNTASQLSVTEIDNTSCKSSLKDNQLRATLTAHNGNLYYYYQSSIEDKDRSLFHQKHFIAPVQLTGQNATCSKAINVPGTLVSASKDGKSLIFNDTSLERFYLQQQTIKDAEGNEKTEVKYIPIVRRHLTAVRLKTIENQGIVASLTDLEDSEKVSADSMTSVGAELWYVEGGKVQARFGGPINFRRIGFPGSYNTYKGHSLVTLKLNDQGRFLRDAESLDLGMDAKHARLAAVFNGSESLILVTGGRYVYAFSASSQGITKLQLQTVDANFTKQNPTNKVPLLNVWSLNSYGYDSGLGGSSKSVHFNRELSSVEVLQGDYGIVQFYVVR